MKGKENGKDRKKRLGFARSSPSSPDPEPGRPRKLSSYQGLGHCSLLYFVAPPLVQSRARRKSLASCSGHRGHEARPRKPARQISFQEPGFYAAYKGFIFFHAMCWIIGRSRVSVPAPWAEARCLAGKAPSFLFTPRSLTRLTRPPPRISGPPKAHSCPIHFRSCPPIFSVQ